MPPALKRARTSSATSSTTASRAVQQAIATLASSSGDLDPALFSQLLGSLHDAHAIALEQEGVVPKVEASEEEEGPRAIASPQVSPQPQPQAEEHSSSFSGRWWTRTVQVDDKTDEVVKRVLEDVEAALPKLDELGILLRPRCVEGKIDLMAWEFAIPGKAEWSASLFKGTFKFSSEYPKKAPQVRTVPPLFHPNVYPSGTIAHRYRQLAETLNWPAADSDIAKEHYVRGLGNVDEWYRSLPPILRIPIILHACRLALQFPNLDDPAQFEAYQSAKKTPDLYIVRQKEEAASLMPTMADALDLEDARKRFLAREAK